MGKIIGIISIKGGVGKTSTVSGLGGILAKDFNQKVLLVDANFSSPQLGLQVGVFNPEVTLHHVLNDQAKIKDSICETSHGFDLIPGALVFNGINPFKLGDKLRELRNKYDFILIDSSPNLNEEILATMIASDELFVVTTADYVTLASTLRAIKLAKEKKTPISGLILNKVHNKKFEIGLEDIENSTGVCVLAVLPHELGVLEAHSLSQPSSLYKNSESTKEYRKLASSLLGLSTNQKPGFFKRVFGKVPKQEVNRVVFSQERHRWV